MTVLAHPFPSPNLDSFLQSDSLENLKNTAVGFWQWSSSLFKEGIRGENCRKQFITLFLFFIIRLEQTKSKIDRNSTIEKKYIKI